MVVDQRTDEDRAADRLFRALADTTRRDILRRVLVDGSSVSALAARYEMSFAAVQKHVSVLAQAHLVVKERHGREQIVRGDVATVRRAAALLEQLEELWEARVDRMSAVLAELDPGRGPAHDPAADAVGPQPAAAVARVAPRTGGTP
ncbi:winged helix-turn-helix transcriptional regulator [Cellulomonas sp. zg-ZUI222]|uniref:Winged helix-turn-helix transcriptional regulator n=1 Tax=Cellulomonas wangleii TaxID=2816956 RepID=A0ABX8DAH9_9CELL|nr:MULTISPECIES: metalloregulator ArsR/SmtB family transcription factor [Cellulomonas]MBO0900929.1 winged helix-turn-helix transcriptional regulator [Cellulomonas sp. zg-ZUI22]MBO0921584.1 winged helix-turn-helix transcriptional regulator [Cellulomonas wangleii]MBO0925080.1 winged helix-turn-helix transcriptional regulator [Cellulomonas wangleii]QVI63506.1 winged helix-turn-helix transcriptional regulator [Cellulomonas wangleii]